MEINKPVKGFGVYNGGKHT